MAKKEKNKSMKKEYRYNKQAVIKSEKYEDYTDLLTAILVDGKDYTILEVNELISNFLKKEV